MVILLELNGANAFKVRDDQNGIRALETTAEDLNALIETNRLYALKGIGKGLSSQIEILYRNEPDLEYADLQEKKPPGLLDMLKLPGIGPKKVSAMHELLGISSLRELEYACHENRFLSSV